MFRINRRHARLAFEGCGDFLPIAIDSAGAVQCTDMAWSTRSILAMLFGMP